MIKRIISSLIYGGLFGASRGALAALAVWANGAPTWGIVAVFLVIYFNSLEHIK